ncbi:MAG: acetolactate synthase small subunit [Gammaproteobacteria bacterium]|jgi:acetolactate synthase-1/3 small subunit|nr:MAG: acetolactate synthase small subunit [Gammaproteobacteria bacterium]
MRHIISVLLQNEAGALGRVAGMFSTRGYNIESLSVAPTDEPAVSRLTLVTTGDDAVITQIVNQLQKLVDVVLVDDLTRGAHFERETALLKFRVSEAGLDPLARLVTEADGKILSGALGSFTVALTESEAAINRFIAEATQHAPLIEVVRSGALAIGQGPRTLRLAPVAAGMAPRRAAGHEGC